MWITPTYVVRLLIASCLAALLFPHAATADERDRDQVTIYRDSWGVPHVYAETEAAGAYGLGYAQQAEDRLGDIYQAVRTGMGSMSEAFGEQHIQQDYTMRLWKNAELAEQRWAELPEHLQEIQT